MNAPFRALAPWLLAVAGAQAQTSGTATYLFDVANPVLAPGQSTAVTVRVAFDPGIGQVIGSGSQSGPVKWLWSGGFGINGDAAAGVTGGWSGNTLDPPYNYFPGSPGVNAGLDVSGVIWVMPTLLIHPNPTNPEPVWNGTFTAGIGSQPGVVTLEADSAATYPVTVIFGLTMMAEYQSSTGPGASISIVCYADCDTSGSLSIADFACFQTAFATGSGYADCNASGSLTIADFACFQAAFAAGCP